MASHSEVFTRRFGGGKRMYYLDVKTDANGDPYIVISESTRKEGDKKLRSRVMVWKEDFEDLFEHMKDLEEFIHQHPRSTPSPHDLPPHRQRHAGRDQPGDRPPLRRDHYASQPLRENLPEPGADDIERD